VAYLQGKKPFHQNSTDVASRAVFKHKRNSVITRNEVSKQP
jgi:hypothetical protein